MKLIITEKFKQALNIAKAIEKYYSIKFNVKVKNNVKVFVSNSFTIIPLSGHITEYDTIGELSKYWTFSSVIEILKNENALIKKIKDFAYVQTILYYAKSCNEIIIATDSDEEGENIGLEVLEILRNNNIVKPVKRLWLTTTLQSDIIEALKNLRNFNENLALSVEARRKIDAIIGFAGTRELTLRFSKNIFEDIFSFGRVQTATLWLIVKREREISQFVPKKYWVIKAKVMNTTFFYVKNSIDSREEAKKIYSKEEAERIYNKIKNSKEFICTKVIERKEIEKPPSPLNTNMMLEISSKYLGFSPVKTLELAEKLYLDGIITYPRVENQTYTEKFNHKLNLMELKKSKFDYYVDFLINNNLFYPTKGKFAEDHEPITPIKGIKNYEDKNAYKLYELILKHYLTILSPNSIFLIKNVEGLINGFLFFAEGKKIIEEGFYKIYYKKPKIKKIDEFKENKKYKVLKVYIEEKETKPPKRYTVSDLLTEMEKVNIGTKSTRAQILETLKERHYIEIKNKTIYPTEKGKKIIETLENIWKDYITPSLTSKVQEEMNKIAKGEINWKDFVNKESEEFYKQILNLRKKLN